MEALKKECTKLGVMLTEPSEGELAWDGTLNESLALDNPVISTYDDHRMAMAFAPVALFGKGVRIEDAMLVTKSYPSFYEDLQAVGFKVEEVTL